MVTTLQHGAFYEWEDKIWQAYEVDGEGYILFNEEPSENPIYITRYGRLWWASLEEADDTEIVIVRTRVSTRFTVDDLTEVQPDDEHKSDIFWDSNAFYAGGDPIERETVEVPAQLLDEALKVCEWHQQHIDLVDEAFFKVEDVASQLRHVLRTV